MKKRVFTLLTASLLGAATLLAKEIRVARFKVTQMHCENCVKKIRENIRFEKGVKDITADLRSKLVTITYDADKNSAERIAEGFAKFHYKAELIDERKQPQKK
ncbi:MAG: heavy-metal-associated domain-containing protein [Prevotellaceae bacterium]|jgi:copper chaperone CopZ|nr:heavy-metal-associated domain-containing protein [Prevotellaceae bacterium]